MGKLFYPHLKIQAAYLLALTIKLRHYSNATMPLLNFFK